MKVHNQLLFVLALAASAGCGPNPDEPVLSTRSNLYNPGDQVVVEIMNGGEEPIGYNICHAFLTLERQRDDGWEEVQVGLGPEPESPCTTQLNLLETGQRDEATAYLPENLPLGMYRMTTGVEIGPELTVLQTEPFEVRS